MIFALRANPVIQVASTDLPEPRDPDIAVHEEYEATICIGTREALELFIFRYADHPLADEAREELERLMSSGSDH